MYGLYVACVWMIFLGRLAVSELAQCMIAIVNFLVKAQSYIRRFLLYDQAPIQGVCTKWGFGIMGTRRGPFFGPLYVLYGSQVGLVQ